MPNSVENRDAVEDCWASQNLHVAPTSSSCRFPRYRDLKTSRQKTRIDPGVMRHHSLGTERKFTNSQTAVALVRALNS